MPLVDGACQTDSGYSYADLCTTVLNSDECDEARRGATRFWGNDFDVYEVLHTLVYGMRVSLIVGAALRAFFEVRCWLSLELRGL